ncbi:MAG: GTP-dependent dephospho-CoA kinase family protein [Methanomicrobiales archaeon]|nr:GTP-dependent dephospho-CoA kinase family protein [Methanomicrobiales archaeon]MDI6876852.1 GTP-dependent dephospho-CoA kinase family protein [Methanomicrobiales archaeon]
MYRLPDAHRSRFQRPFGTLYSGIPEVLPLLRGRVVYAVGDVVTHNLTRRGVVPDVAVIDGHTMRAPCSRTPDLKSRRLRAHNPPGAISDDLIQKVREAILHPPAVVVVEGEEDLAVIPMVLQAPIGAIVLYGQPGEGVVVREVSEEAKAEAEALLALFERE